MKQRFCGTYLAFMIQLATILHHYYLFKLENYFKLGIVEQTKLNMHTTYALTLSAVLDSKVCILNECGYIGLWSTKIH